MSKKEKSLIDLKNECKKKITPHVWDDIKHNCVKNIDTVDIFLKKPLIGSLAIALLAYFFAAVLFKIKGTPLSKTNSIDPTRGKYIKCGPIETDKLLFTKDPLLGIVKEEAYNPSKKKQYSKIFWPWLSPFLYPSAPNRSGKGKKSEKQSGGNTDRDENKKRRIEKKSDAKKSKDEDVAAALAKGKLDVQYLCLVPFYLTLTWTTRMYYSVFSVIKNTFYKSNHWGSLGEINKINKKLWLSDFFVVFLCIPLLIFMVMPIMMVFVLMFGFVAWGKTVFWNIAKSDHLREKPESWGWTVLWYLQLFLLQPILLMLTSGFATFGVMFLHILWFGSILIGQQETEGDGLKTVIKTWANIIWDYKFIWAILAVGIWLENFRTYLSGTKAKDLGVYQSEGFFSFITKENREMILGTVGGAIVILLLMKQSSYYGSLSNKSPKSRDCTEGCEPDYVEPDEKSSGKCKNPDYDPERTMIGRLKATAGEKMRTMANANKSQNVVDNEAEIRRIKKDTEKMGNT